MLRIYPGDSVRTRTVDNDRDAAATRYGVGGNPSTGPFYIEGALPGDTLVVHGDGDLLPTRLATETAALIPRARAVIIPGAGHMPFYEQPADFFAQALDFLNARDQGG